MTKVADMHESSLKKLWQHNDKEKLLEYFNSIGSNKDVQKEIIAKHKTDALGMTLIHWAAYKDDLNAVKSLIEYNINPHIRDSNVEGGRSTLDWARATSEPTHNVENYLNSFFLSRGDFKPELGGHAEDIDAT